MLVFAGENVTASLSAPKKTSKNKMFVVLNNKPEAIKAKEMESYNPSPKQHVQVIGSHRQKVHGLLLVLLCSMPRLSEPESQTLKPKP